MEAAHDSAEHYAFFNHSSSTIPNDLAPNVDDKPLARQKRKRTSAEDQAVLEAAYNRDPKPDKAARLDLVKHVALGEKEVQIWFQNRRQSSRRKMRPLLPHEVAQYQMSVYGSLLQHPSSDEAFEDHDASLEESSTRLLSNGGLWSGSTSHDEHDAFALVPLKDISPSTQHKRQPQAAVDLTVTEGHVPLTTSMTKGRAWSATTERSSTALQGAPPLQDDLARRHVSSAAQAERRDQSPCFRDGSSHYAEYLESARALRKSSSYVRLSMSFDGNASVVTKDGSAPSPPRQGHNLLMSDGGSVATSRPSNGSGTSALSSLQRTSSGRSRDSRAWEFWCDKDARSELDEKAEKDSSGSAADAIGLLRSASGRTVLGSIPAKRNSLLSQTSSEHKRTRFGRPRPPLQRSRTSLGRLQGKPLDEQAPKPKLKAAESAVAIYIPGNDSDKENWSPESERPHTSGRGARVAQDSFVRAPLGQSNRGSNGAVSGVAAGSRANGTIRRPVDGENRDPEADAEIAAFMKSGRNSTSTSSDDDLDCVQGLLSLSQGNWR